MIPSNQQHGLADESTPHLGPLQHFWEELHWSSRVKTVHTSPLTQTSKVVSANFGCIYSIVSRRENRKRWGQTLVRRLRDTSRPVDSSLCTGLVGIKSRHKWKKKTKNQMGREKDLDLLLLLLLLVVCPRLPLFFFQENLHDRWRWNWEGTGPGHSGGGVKVSFLLLLVAFSPTFFSSLKVLRLLRLWEFDDCVFLSPTSRFQTCWNREFDNQNGKTRFLGGELSNDSNEI